MIEKLEGDFFMLRQKGQIIPIMIGILFAFLILIYAITEYLRNESKWTFKEKQSSTAFHLAEAGLDRAVWKLNGTTGAWDKVIATASIPDLYKGTTVFFEPGKGYYKVLISSARVADEDQVIIKSVGTDELKKETRGIKAIFARTGTGNTAIKADKGVRFGGNAKVYWGSVMSDMSNIKISDKHPRKYAGIGFYVDGRDPDGLGPICMGDTNGSDPRNQPLPDELKDWSSNGCRDIPATSIDLSSYAALAQAYRTPSEFASKISWTTSGPNPAGSGYFPDSANTVSFGKDYEDKCSTAVYYIEGNVSLNKVFIGPAVGTSFNRVAMIIHGNVVFPNGSGSQFDYFVQVPTDAWKEYQAIDTDSANQYPGDSGFRNTVATFNVGKYGSGAVIFHGFMYVGNNVDPNTGNKKIVGVLIVKGAVLGESGTVDVFYSKTADENIIYAGSIFRRNYWAEFSPGSFDSPSWDNP